MTRINANKIHARVNPTQFTAPNFVSFTAVVSFDCQFVPIAVIRGSLFAFAVSFDGE